MTRRAAAGAHPVLTGRIGVCYGPFNSRFADVISENGAPGPEPADGVAPAGASLIQRR